MSARILHFSLGPVQGFIDDARRTRDYWAGSFLLSWLSGHAMKAITAKGGAIIDFPEVDMDAMFSAISKPPGDSPIIGSLPNRFKAIVSDPAFDAGNVAANAITYNWKQLADAVWAEFVEPYASSYTKAIWDRQVDQFWTMNWVIGEGNSAAKDSLWLSSRKNWCDVYHDSEDRQSEPPVGDLCGLMGLYQEISGYSRISSKNKQSKFWAKLSQSVGPLNLKADERLCAIALIKRLFAKLSNVESIIGWKPGGRNINVVNWPSVSYLAAVPWLNKIIAGNGADANAFNQVISKSLKSGFKGETETKIFGLGEDIAKLDGHLFHEYAILNMPDEDFNGDAAASRKALRTALASLNVLAGSKASEYYAILRMDGDSIGSRISTQSDTIKTGLGAFTESVTAYFDPAGGNRANGILIYAGGDDVLVFLPLESALEAAQYLQQKYTEAFGGREDFTISASIVYAQFKIPLSAVLRQSHHYLDAIAKAQNGRDSLALAVLKPGGISYEWVSTWDASKIEIFLAVIEDGFTGPLPKYSSGLIYNIRARNEPILSPLAGETTATPFHDAEFLRALFKTEYKRQPGVSKLADTEIDQAVEDLIEIGQTVCSDGKLNEAFRFDALLMAHFLSTQIIRGDDAVSKSGGQDDA